MVRSRLCLRKMSRMAMRALILVSVFWTELVKTLPVEDMYVKFLSGNSNLKNCSNYDVSQLETDIFKGLCSLHPPSVKDFSQDQKKIIQDIKFNLPPLLCYTIFHNVYAVCHPDTKIPVKPEGKSSKSNEDFCEDIPTISLPDTCTHWLDDPDYNSKDDCFLVNEVIKAVLNNNNFCKNKCLVPDPDESVPPSVNPLCEKLLDTSLILAQMAPRGPVSAEKQAKNSSSSSSDLTPPPPGLTKQDDTQIVPEKGEANEAGENVTPKPGEKVLDTKLVVVEGNTTVKSEVESPLAVANNNTKLKDNSKVSSDLIVHTNDSQIKDLELNDKSGTNDSFEKYTKTNVKSNTTAAVVEDKKNSNKSSINTIVAVEENKKISNQSNNTTAEDKKNSNQSKSSDTIAAVKEDKKISNQSSMAGGSDLNIESSASFTSAFGFDYDSRGSSPAASNEDEDLEVPDIFSNMKENKKENQEADLKTKSKAKGEVDAEPLVGEEEKNEADVGKSDDKKDDSNEAKKPSDDNVKEELALPKAEKEIVETKYVDKMTTGPEIDDRSSFFGYFILLSIVAIIAYLVFHNKQKILALILEGRRRQGNRRRSGGKEYRKLDSNLEDTMDPNRETSLRQVIY
eukprot:GFUD01018188.1.p1 GENE.GFUD01018188.1~~GFUD01018188.1.p1  ORF type:complete len:624 (-),score=173.41 GFUD01018188.1:87-1958(-)